MSAYDTERTTAAQLVGEAGKIALDYFHRGVEAEYKEGDEPVTEADRAVNRFLVDALAARFPNDAILSEEAPPDPRRFSARRTWMVDPIDGTREFLRGTDGWEVMVGLVDGGRPVAGAVMNPLNETLFQASRGAGAWMSTSSSRRRLSVPAPRGLPTRMAIRRGRNEGVTRRVADALGITHIVEKGGFGVRGLMVATETEVDFVLHVGGRPREWDTCALQVILEESGAALVNCLGARPRYLKEDLVQPHGMIVAAAPAIGPLVQVIAPLYREHLEAEHRGT